VDAESKTFLGIINSNLEQIVASYARIIPTGDAALTPTEMKVADLVRHGKTNKEIAALLNMSVNGVAFHRKSIRNKLGIKQKKINLQSFLRSSV
jgi:DNA-binding CsgD family transcriptional regulator